MKVPPYIRSPPAAASGRPPHFISPRGFDPVKRLAAALPHRMKKDRNTRSFGDSLQMSILTPGADAIIYSVFQSA